MPHLHYKAHHVSPFEATPVVKESKPPASLRRSEDKLALLEKLNMSIELESLLATYTAELCRLVPVSGLEYQHLNDKLQLKYSKASNMEFSSHLLFNLHSIGQLKYQSTMVLNTRQRQLIASVEDQLLQPLFNVLQFEKNKRMSMFDYLTKIGNRNYFEDTLAHMVATSSRETRSFTLLFVDLDNFKAVNDTYGHLEGDRVLIEFSALLKSAIRNNDYVFRFGGDEFSLLLAHSDNVRPEFVAQRIVNLTNANKLLSNHHVTASIGFANWQPNITGQALVEQADSALYYVKHQGKNGFSKAG
ncbi:MAG: GGDEF domain-containing protein [Gammaproteobacteria bacterium]|nr:GGDEF domain-containing protein [Gammaproteobacteria bacterium]